MCLSLTPRSRFLCLLWSQNVRKAVLSFPAGSSGGPDGLRPQHLKDLIQCRESRSNFLTALTGFTNLVLAGRCLVDVAPIFFGGRLIALTKKSGGIRPIAVGFTLRRLVSKCANTHVIARLSTLFSVQSGWEWARQVAVRRRPM